MKKTMIALFVLVSCLFMQVDFAFANEKMILSSAEKVAKKWEILLKETIYGVRNYSHNSKDADWSAIALKYMKGTLGYNVRKTDSLTSPYMLTISFTTLMNVNMRSPNANVEYIIYNSTDKKRKFFKTPEDALSNLKPEDFDPTWLDYNVELYYAYQKGQWILKGGNDSFWLYEAYVKAQEIKKNR